MDEHYKKASIIQWNARGLRSRLSDFRQLVYKYSFPIIVICESNLPKDIQLSRYEKFDSSCTNSASRVTMFIRRDLTYTAHVVSTHPTNEYVCATISNGKMKFTIIAAYIPPKTLFDRQHLESILNTMPPPFILTGDFNAHHPIWGSIRTNLRGRHLAELADDYHLSTINDGTPTYFYGTEGSSCLDLTFVSAALTSQTTWFADIETRGSDHVPTQ